jgi:hypothetical protein
MSCQAAGCSFHNKPLVPCSCSDGKHAPVAKKEWLKVAVLATVAVLVVAYLFLRTPDSGPSSYADKLIVVAPERNALITSPLILTGSARGPWYFEASFPVRLFDAQGNEVAVVPAQAEGEWMTEEFVPFAATLTFVAPTSDTGTLVFQRDNPSGLPENDDSFSLPVRFR